MATKPTLRHVALAAGVSAPTVSKILNGQGNYSPETVAKVRAAADALGYRSDAVARTMRTGGGRIVGVLIDRASTRPTPTAPRLFWLRYLDQLVDCFSEAGAGVLAVSSDNPELLGRLPIDALVVVSGSKGFAFEPVGYGIPVVGFGESAEYAVSVSHDYDDAAQAVADHFGRIGSMSTAVISPTDERGFSDLLVASYLKCCDSNGMPVRHWEFDPTSDVHSVVAEVVAHGADSLFVVGGVSQAVQAALTSLGRPDISLIVQSEGIVESHLSPRVSTLSFCARESAHVVAAALLATLEDGRQRTEVLPFSLDIRE